MSVARIEGVLNALDHRSTQDRARPLSAGLPDGTTGARHRDGARSDRIPGRSRAGRRCRSLVRV
jgi:hypothetical protein